MNHEILLKHLAHADPRVVVMVVDGRLVQRTMKRTPRSWPARKARVYNQLVRMGAERGDELALNNVLDRMQVERIEVEHRSMQILRDVLVKRVFGQPREEMGTWYPPLL